MKQLDKIIFIGSFLLLVLSVCIPYNLFSQQKRLVEIIQADQMRNLKRGSSEIRRLIGNVIIRHDQVTISCDSLYEYIDDSKIDAFGKIIIHQDSSNLYGDILNFNKNSKKGTIKGKIVRLIDKDITLIANFLDFDVSQNTVNYSTGGIIHTKSSHFSSRKGYYFSNEKLVTFYGNVAYRDSDILLNTDTLHYYSQDEFIKFFGPTQIYNKQIYLYGELGSHNRKTSRSEIYKSVFIDNGDQKIVGDSVIYDKETQLSEIFGNGSIIDTTRKVSVYGQSMRYYQDQKLAIVSKNPLALFITEKPDSVFLRANTITAKSIENPNKSDTTNFYLITGISNVRFFKDDIQGLCDSMIYNGFDSIMYMHQTPILWNDVNQLTANTVDIHFRNDNIYKMYFKGSAFIASQEDSTRFNQMKGREMIGNFDQGKLFRLDINGNGEAVYFMRDKGEITAVNRAESSRINIGIRDNKVITIMFRDKVKSNLYPIKKIELKDVMIKGFEWHIEQRPLSKQNIIPNGLDINFYKPIHQKANLAKQKKRNPADTLSSAGFK